MRVRFIACEDCGRHVRQGDGTCPFCGARAPVAPAVERVLSRGLSRAALLAAGTAGAVIAMADCGNVSSTAFYGAAVVNDAGLSVDAADEDGNVMGGVFYGVGPCVPTPCDSGAEATDAAADSGDATAESDAGSEASPDGSGD